MQHMRRYVVVVVVVVFIFNMVACIVTRYGSISINKIDSKNNLQ